jgi:hypothetical protein
MILGGLVLLCTCHLGLDLLDLLQNSHDATTDTTPIDDVATDEGVNESRRAGSEAWGREREMIHNASTARETSNNNNKRRKKRRKKNQGKIRKLAGLRGMGEVWRMLRAFADSPTPPHQHRNAP